MNTNTNLFFNYFSLRMPFETFLDTLMSCSSDKSSDKHARGCSFPSNFETTSNFLTFKHLPTYKILSGLPNCFQKDLIQLGTFAPREFSGAHSTQNPFQDPQNCGFDLVFKSQSIPPQKLKSYYSRLPKISRLCCSPLFTSKLI